MEKCKIGLFHQTKKSSIYLWAWHPIIGALFQKFCCNLKCLNDLVGPTHIKKDRKTKTETTKNSDFQWTDKHQKAFNLLKAHLTSEPVLGYPDFTCPFNLETDAQKDEYGQSKVIAYAS